MWAARYLAMNGKRRLLGSFWHGSMANAMAQAIGAQAAFPGRQVISLSGDGGFTMLMGDFLSLVQHRLPVKVVVFNNGALGFIELEQKSTGFLDFGTELKNPNFAAMAEAVGIRGIRLEDPAEVDDGIAAALAHDGPVLDRCGRQPDGARHAALDHAGDGEGLHALHGEGRDQRPGRRGRRPREDQSLALMGRWTPGPLAGQQLRRAADPPLQSADPAGIAHRRHSSAARAVSILPESGFLNLSKSDSMQVQANQNESARRGRMSLLSHRLSRGTGAHVILPHQAVTLAAESPTVHG